MMLSPRPMCHLYTSNSHRRPKLYFRAGGGRITKSELVEVVRLSRPLRNMASYSQIGPCSVGCHDAKGMLKVGATTLLVLNKSPGDVNEAHLMLRH